MKISNIRLEVMQTIEQSMDGILEKFLKPIDTNWQPADFLPDSRDDDFFDQIREIQGQAQEMGYDLLTVLVGDTITEEALPTYEAWLMDVEGVDQDANNGWSKWVRSWTAEENRHGDVLNKYLYLCGQINMREMEKSTQYLIADGFDIGTGRDPYRNFIYTSFQELATNVSHKRVAAQAKKTGNELLAKMCAFIAADEARHASAYINFVDRILEIDASNMMVAFEDMMRKKIVMPAVLLKQTGDLNEDLFDHFSNCAQRIGVYTTQDYIDILKSLISQWKIETIGGLDEAGEKARDYIAKLPDRLQRISGRITVPQKHYEFKWIGRPVPNQIIS